jgi:3-oxoacyl-[acyl-carrier-protein] synthase II
MQLAMKRAAISPDQIDLVSSHATGTTSGDVQECEAIRLAFGDVDGVAVNNTKSFIGHAMGAAGALELAGNLPALEDGVVHPTINLDELDPECELKGLVANQPRETGKVEIILNSSFGMLGINSVVIVQKV